MYLKTLSVVNYKSCKNLSIDLCQNDPTILVGVNDCGKSTLLKAIELLLSSKPSFHYEKTDKKRNDISNTAIEEHEFSNMFEKLGLSIPSYEKNKCYIIGNFSIEAHDLAENITEGLSIHVQWIINNEDITNIWLLREFNTITFKHQDYLYTQDIKNDQEIFESYFSLTAAKLQIQRKIHQILDEEINNFNNKGRFSNLEIAKAIYNRFSVNYYWISYNDFSKDKLLFPECSYLDWNISLEILNQFTNQIMTNQVSEDFKDAFTYAQAKAEIAQKLVNRELENFRREFATDLPNITAIKANVIFNLESKIIDLHLNKANVDGDVHIESQGDGIKRQIWFALIKYKALHPLLGMDSRKRFIWCFDEPETHLYPKAQREFFEIIKQVSKGNVQTVISTHSTIFIDRAKIKNIFSVSLKDFYTTHSTCKAHFEVFEALQIRNSDFLFYDKFLIVEGDTDFEIIPHVYKLTYGRNLSDSGVQILQLSGKNNVRHYKSALDQIINEFSKSADRVVYLFDNDVKIDNIFTENEQAAMKNFFTLGKQDIEDSISSEVWANIVNDRLGELVISVEKIDKLKALIPNDVKIQKSQKFYSVLKSELKQILGPDNHQKINDLFPNKGKDLGKMICEYIDNIEQVDDSIVKVFEILNMN